MTTPRFLLLASLVALSALPVLGQSPTVGGCPVFPADNIWNTPVDQLPVAAASSTWVTTIGRTGQLRIDAGSGLWQGGPIGIPYLTVPGTQQKYPATFRYAAESDPGPYAIPLNAPIQGGSQATGDRHVVTIETTNCILYEMWAAYPQASSWSAGSGAIHHLRSNALRPSGWTSADAAGLPVFAGLVRYEEVAAGEIRHALRFTVPQTRNTFVWPARHFASSLTGSQYPPMGARFRLRASFDISGFSKENQVILRALKKYGMILADNGSPWWLGGVPDERWNNDDIQNLKRVTGENFEAVDVSGLMIDPNSGQARQETVVSVTVSPSSVSLAVGATTQFSASVTNSTNQLVSWSVNGVDGGNSQTGWISTNGLYTAPAAVPSTGKVTVEATSNASPSAVGKATVQITAPALPSMTSISPASGLRGSSVPVTIAGTNFTSGAIVILSGSGITVSNVSLISATQLRATFTIAASATVGARSVSVKTAAGTSAGKTFTVSAPSSVAPILTALIPSSISRGQTMTVLLKGSNLKLPATVTVGGAGVTVSRVSLFSSSMMTATLQASSSAQPGSRAVRVETADGVSNSLTLTVR